MPSLTQVLDGAMSFLGSSADSVRRNPRTSAALAFGAVASVGLAGLARRFAHRRRKARTIPERRRTIVKG